MALSSGLLRRAAPPRVFHLARHLHNRLFNFQFLSFSTKNADKFENDIDSCSNEVVPLPSGSFFHRRASSSSALHLHNRLFSTFSANLPPPEASEQSPSVAEFCNPEPTATKTRREFSFLDGVPADFVEDGFKDGILTFRRKTEDEIIEIQIKLDEDHYVEVADIRRLLMHIKILYGDNFNKCMEFDVIECPEDRSYLSFREVRMSLDDEVKHDSQVHLDELEDLLEKRGINGANLDFIARYLEKITENNNYNDKRFLIRRVLSRERQ